MSIGTRWNGAESWVGAVPSGARLQSRPDRRGDQRAGPGV